ncbi:unnamed protein product [Amoebophrya sp. A120]|nr:unnamed protein product [Amoebophrya sp. A120]|eukprot:GSA120T00024733001.1
MSSGSTAVAADQVEPQHNYSSMSSDYYNPPPLILPDVPGFKAGKKKRSKNHKTTGRAAKLETYNGNSDSLNKQTRPFLDEHDPNSRSQMMSYSQTQDEELDDFDQAMLFDSRDLDETGTGEEWPAPGFDFSGGGGAMHTRGGRGGATTSNHGANSTGNNSRIGTSGTRNGTANNSNWSRTGTRNSNYEHNHQMLSTTQSSHWSKFSNERSQNLDDFSVDFADLKDSEFFNFPNPDQDFSNTDQSFFRSPEQKTLATTQKRFALQRREMSLRRRRIDEKIRDLGQIRRKKKQSITDDMFRMAPVEQQYQQYSTSTSSTTHREEKFSSIAHKIQNKNSYRNTWNEGSGSWVNTSQANATTSQAFSSNKEDVDPHYDHRDPFHQAASQKPVAVAAPITTIAPPSLHFLPDINKPTSFYVDPLEQPGNSNQLNHSKNTGANPSKRATFCGGFYTSQDNNKDIFDHDLHREEATSKIWTTRDDSDRFRETGAAGNSAEQLHNNANDASVDHDDFNQPWVTQSWSPVKQRGPVSTRTKGKMMSSRANSMMGINSLTSTNFVNNSHQTARTFEYHLGLTKQHKEQMNRMRGSKSRRPKGAANYNNSKFWATSSYFSTTTQDKENQNTSFEFDSLNGGNSVEFFNSPGAASHLQSALWDDDATALHSRSVDFHDLEGAAGAAGRGSWRRNSNNHGGLFDSTTEDMTSAGEVPRRRRRIDFSSSADTERDRREFSLPPVLNANVVQDPVVLDHAASTTAAAAGSGSSSSGSSWQYVGPAAPGGNISTGTASVVEDSVVLPPQEPQPKMQDRTNLDAQHDPFSSQTEDEPEMHAVPSWARAGIQLERPDGRPAGSEWANGAMAYSENGSTGLAGATTDGAGAARSSQPRRTKKHSNKFQFGNSPSTTSLDHINNQSPMTNTSATSTGSYTNQKTGITYKLRPAGLPKASIRPIQSPMIDLMERYNETNTNTQHAHLVRRGTNVNQTSSNNGPHEERQNFLQVDGAATAASGSSMNVEDVSKGLEQAMSKIDFSSHFSPMFPNDVESSLRDHEQFLGNHRVGLEADRGQRHAIGAGPQHRNSLPGVRSPPKNSSMRVLFPDMLNKHKDHSLHKSLANKLFAHANNSGLTDRAAAGGMFGGGDQNFEHGASNFVSNPDHQGNHLDANALTYNGLGSGSPVLDLMVAGRELFAAADKSQNIVGGTTEVSSSTSPVLKQERLAFGTDDVAADKNKTHDCQADGGGGSSTSQSDAERGRHQGAGAVISGEKGRRDQSVLAAPGPSTLTAEQSTTVASSSSEEEDATKQKNQNATRPSRGPSSRVMQDIEPVEPHTSFDDNQSAVTTSTTTSTAQNFALGQNTSSKPSPPRRQSLSRQQYSQPVEILPSGPPMTIASLSSPSKELKNDRSSNILGAFDDISKSKSQVNASLLCNNSQQPPQSSGSMSTTATSLKWTSITDFSFPSIQEQPRSSPKMQVPSAAGEDVGAAAPAGGDFHSVVSSNSLDGVLTASPMRPALPGGGVTSGGSPVRRGAPGMQLEQPPVILRGGAVLETDSSRKTEIGGRAEVTSALHEEDQDNSTTVGVATNSHSLEVGEDVSTTQQDSCCIVPSEEREGASTSAAGAARSAFQIKITQIDGGDAMSSSSRSDANRTINQNESIETTTTLPQSQSNKPGAGQHVEVENSKARTRQLKHRPSLGLSSTTTLVLPPQEVEFPDSTKSAVGGLQKNDLSINIFPAFTGNSSRRPSLNNTEDLAESLQKFSQQQHSSSQQLPASSNASKQNTPRLSKQLLALPEEVNSISRRPSVTLSSTAQQNTANSARGEREMNLSSAREASVERRRRVSVIQIGSKETDNYNNDAEPLPGSVTNRSMSNEPVRRVSVGSVGSDHVAAIKSAGLHHLPAANLFGHPAGGEAEHELPHQAVDNGNASSSSGILNAGAAAGGTNGHTTEGEALAKPSGTAVVHLKDGVEAAARNDPTLQRSVDAAAAAVGNLLKLIVQEDELVPGQGVLGPRPEDLENQVTPADSDETGSSSAADHHMEDHPGARRSLKGHSSGSSPASKNEEGAAVSAAVGGAATATADHGGATGAPPNRRSSQPAGLPRCTAKRSSFTIPEPPPRPKTRLQKKEFVEEEIASIEREFERAKRNAQRGDRVVMLGPERAKVKLLRTMATFLGEFDAAIKARKVDDSSPAGAMRYFLTMKYKTLRRAFQFFDFNANGSLAYIELSSGLNMILPKIWPDYDTIDFLFGGSAEEIYKAIDTDEDGNVDVKEFLGSTKKAQNKNGGKNGKGRNSRYGSAFDPNDPENAHAGSKDGSSRNGTRGSDRNGSLNGSGRFGGPGNGDEDGYYDCEEDGYKIRTGSNGSGDGFAGNGYGGSADGSGGGYNHDGLNGNKNRRYGPNGELLDEDGNPIGADEEGGSLRNSNSLVKNLGDNAFAYVKGWTGTADPTMTKNEARRRFLEKMENENAVPDGWYLDENGNWVNRDTGETLSDEEFRNRFGKDFDRLGWGFGGENGATGRHGRNGQYGNSNGLNGFAPNEGPTAEEVTDGILQKVFIAACQGQKTTAGKQNGMYESIMVRRIFPTFLNELDVCDLTEQQLIKIFDQQMVLQQQWTYASHGVSIREGLTYEFFKLALHEITRLGRVSFSDFVDAC